MEMKVFCRYAGQRGAQGRKYSFPKCENFANQTENRKVLYVSLFGQEEHMIPDCSRLEFDEYTTLTAQIQQ